MRYNQEETELLLEAVNCDTDWIELYYAVLKFPEFFTLADREYILNWLDSTEDLFIKF